MISLIVEGDLDLILVDILKIIQTHIPKFKLIISWRCIRLNSLLTPLTKPAKDLNNRRACVYHFKCACQIHSYIGQTKRLVKTRISEHGQKSRNTEVGSHIFNCEIYKNSLKTKFGIKPTPSQKSAFLSSHFSILKDNVFCYFKRTFIENFHIHFCTPSLNKQCKHGVLFAGTMVID